MRDERRSIEAIIRALTNNLLARDNFAPDGEVGQVLMSNGPGSVPSFQDLPAPTATSEDDGEIEASRIVGTLAEARLQGSYRGITSVDVLAVTEHQAALSIGWLQLTSVPTTIAGYGITDAYTKTEVDTLLDALTFADIDGSIADAQVPESAVTQHQAALSIGWSQLTSVPTTLSGYGITDAYTKTETDTLLAAKADSATTLAGYGITDAYTKSAVDALLAALTTGDLTDWPADAAGVLTNDGAGTLTWEAAGGGGALDDLSDVVITTPAAKDALAYDGAEWVNQALDASYIGPETFPTGAGKYIIDVSSAFNTPFEISTSSTCFWGFTIRGYNSLGTWVAGFQIIDLGGTQYGSFAKASSGDANIWLQSYQGGFFIAARAGSIQFATSGTTVKWIMDATTFSPNADKLYDIGTSALMVNNIYSAKYFADSATCGSASMGAGVAEITINTTKVTANSRIFITPTILLPSGDNIFFVSAITAGVSFKIKRLGSSTNSGNVHWLIVDEV